ncbi:MAG: pyridoxal 5'-phosphate synthase glutaminase subunit PdxT [Firmicutes bacterium HGW-Firmicutes-13]|nr:MAG: pyridoxal 5'-phosphate synthase glutaminase subunit PdxT [Firmicutes bacterium HGW-Firmicutes-13]
MKIGVLAVQGAVLEHIDMLKKCGVEAVPVKREEDISAVDALIIPGGESTTIGRLVKKFNLGMHIKKMVDEGKPVYGTCAGMILLAEEIEGEEPHLKLMNIKVLRNAFGRQRESFEADLDVPLLGDKFFPGVFIRAPYVLSAGPEVEVLSSFQDKIVAARQGNILVSAFHPELTDDDRFHRLLISMVKETNGNKSSLKNLIF